MSDSRTRSRADRRRAKEEPPADKRPLAPDLKVVETQVFRGPNYWSYDPAVRLLVDLGALEDWPSNTIPGFVDGLIEMLPGIAEHSCSLGRRGGFGERLREGTWLGHVAEHIALELQRESGAHVYRGKTRSAGEAGRYNVIYGYWEERVGLAAGELAVRLVNQLVRPAEDFDFLAELERLILLAERRAFGPSTQAIIDEAASRDIPWIRLNEASLVQLGWGKYQQRIRATMTSKTSALAVDIAGDKHVTRRLLASAGLPVPRGEIVQSEDEAVAAATSDRVPRRHQAARRQPRARRRARPRGPRTTCATGFRRALPEARRGQVVVESFVDRQRLPRARGGRPHGRGGRTRPGPRRRRRHPHGHRPGRDRELGPAPRHRAREGAHADQGRRRRDRAAPQAGVRPGRRARPPRRS